MSSSGSLPPLCKIEAFDALQPQFGPYQIIPLSKHPFATRPRIENDDVTWSPWYNLPVTRTNKRRALSLPEVELDGWFLIHCIGNMYHVLHAQVYYEFCISFRMFVDRRLGFEPTRQVKGWNMRALQNETYMRASILNTNSPPLDVDMKSLICCKE